jgi:hypothetical protein
MPRMDQHETGGAVTVRVELLRKLLRLQAQTIAVAMLAATFFVPVAAIMEQTDDDEVDQRLKLIQLGFHSADFGEHLDELTDSHPYSAPGGLLLIRIGLGVVLVGLLFVAAMVLTSLDRTSRGAVTLTRIALGVLVLGVMVLAIGLGWFPEYRGSADEDGGAGVGPSWGLWLPLAAAAWIAVCHGWMVEVTRT